jgi:hypothetical protein
MVVPDGGLAAVHEIGAPSAPPSAVVLLEHAPHATTHPTSPRTAAKFETRMVAVYRGAFESDSRR